MIEQFVVWALCLGATTRVIRLITMDTIPLFAKPRAWVANRFGPDHALADLVTCPWCIGVWVSIPAVLSAYFWGHQIWWQLAAAILTLSHAAAWVVIKTDGN